MFELLASPFGLTRSGVAAKHPKLKQPIRADPLEYLPDNYAATENFVYKLAIRRRRWTRRGVRAASWTWRDTALRAALSPQAKANRMGAMRVRSGQQVTGSVGACRAISIVPGRVLAGGPGNPGKFGLAIFTVQALAEVCCSHPHPG